MIYKRDTRTSYNLNYILYIYILSIQQKRHLYDHFTFVVVKTDARNGFPRNRHYYYYSLRVTHVFLLLLSGGRRQPLPSNVYFWNFTRETSTTPSSVVQIIIIIIIINRAVRYASRTRMNTGPVLPHTPSFPSVGSRLACWQKRILVCRAPCT